MWRFLLVVAVIVSVAEAQRSSYAARNKSKLLPRFREQSTSTSSSSTERTLDTRGGDIEEENVNTGLPEDLQGTLEDDSFVYRVSKWPEERQPFWFKNRHAIAAMRGMEVYGDNVSKQPTNRISGSSDASPRFQSFFFGASNKRSRNPQNPARVRSDDGFLLQDDLIRGYNGDSIPQQSHKHHYHK